MEAKVGTKTHGTAIALLPIKKGEHTMLEAMILVPLAAAGWAALITWGLGGGLGMFIVLFVVLKLLGK